MREEFMNLQRIGTLLLLAFFAFPSTGLAAKKKAQGVFTVVKGKVEVQRAGKKRSRAVRVGTKVYPKDTIISAKNSRAKVVMVDENILNISPNSKLEITEYEYDKSNNKKKVMLNLMYGKVRSTVNQKYDGEKNVYRVKTPSAVAGVRGTDFLVNFNNRSRQSQIVTFEGQVQVGAGLNPAGALINPIPVNPGQYTTASPQRPPVPPIPVPQGQLVQMDRETNADIVDLGPKPGTQNGREPANNNNNPKGPNDNSNGQGPENPNDNANNPGQNPSDKRANGKRPGISRPSAGIPSADGNFGPEGEEGGFGPDANRPPEDFNGEQKPPLEGEANIVAGPEGPNPDGSQPPPPPQDQPIGSFDPNRDPASISPDGDMMFMPPPDDFAGTDGTIPNFDDGLSDFDRNVPIPGDGYLYEDIPGTLDPSLADQLNQTTLTIIIKQ